MERYDQGRAYWLICKRFNEWKGKNPGIREVAVGDMVALAQRNRSKAVGMRINTFISRNRTQSPPRNDGPRYA